MTEAATAHRRRPTPATLAANVRMDSPEAAVVEIVWDAGGAATCSAPSGVRLQVGPGAPWAPEDLLAAAVSASVMQTFLAAAPDARIPVLGYVAAAHLRHAAGATPVVDVHACITVSAGVASSVVMALSEHARQTAPLTRLLSATLAVTSDVEVLAGAPCAS